MEKNVVRCVLVYEYVVSLPSPPFAFLGDGGWLVEEVVLVVGDLGQN